MPNKRHLHVVMDITNRCNLQCAMCTRAVLPPHARREMTVEQFRAIGDHCFDRAAVLSLSCGAEPLMAKHFTEILAVLPEYHIPSTEMVTNGQLLDKPRIEALIAARVSRLIVSIDGATAATYESIRRGGKYDRLLANLEQLRQAKRDRRLSYPRVRFNFVMMRSNIEELPNLIELAGELGVSQVTAQHAVIYEGCLPDQESLYHHQALANRTLLAAHRAAARSGVSAQRAPSLCLFQAVAEGKAVAVAQPTGQGHQRPARVRPPSTARPGSQYAAHQSLSPRDPLPPSLGSRRPRHGRQPAALYELGRRTAAGKRDAAEV